MNEVVNLCPLCGAYELVDEEGNEEPKPCRGTLTGRPLSHRHQKAGPWPEARDKAAYDDLERLWLKTAPRP